MDVFSNGALVSSYVWAMVIIGSIAGIMTMISLFWLMAHWWRRWAMNQLIRKCRKLKAEPAIRIFIKAGILRDASIGEEFNVELESVSSVFRRITMKTNCSPEMLGEAIATWLHWEDGRGRENHYTWTSWEVCHHLSQRKMKRFLAGMCRHKNTQLSMAEAIGVRLEEVNLGRAERRAEKLNLAPRLRNFVTSFIERWRRKTGDFRERKDHQTELTIKRGLKAAGLQSQQARVKIRPEDREKK